MVEFRRNGLLFKHCEQVPMGYPCEMSRDRMNIIITYSIHTYVQSSDYRKYFYNTTDNNNM